LEILNRFLTGPDTKGISGPTASKQYKFCIYFIKKKSSLTNLYSPGLRITGTTLTKMASDSNGYPTPLFDLQ